ncbi:MAG: class I SAM-dependent methyltransferase [Desulfobacteraceae bacterium]|nr:class I SAM-dependent methyltransferase [Desulfobacteraceae bacterium]MBU4055416.1 class I SAM-dependent methyltransferase [Pseudomonadota bacterium]
MLGIHDTDREWSRWADHDPFYAVLSDSKYRNRQNLEIFFQTGEEHFKGVVQQFCQLGFPLLRQGQSMDYGCGVGRVLRPMADYFDCVVGIDVAISMLHEAEKYIHGKNVVLKHFNGKNLDDCLDEGIFEFIHSALVLQHIRPKRGFRILENLLQRLSPGGKAYIQLPVYAEKKWAYLINQIVTCHPALLKLSRRLLKKTQYKNDPTMQMNVYPADRLIHLFNHQKVKVISLDVKEDLKNSLLTVEWYLVKH